MVRQMPNFSLKHTFYCCIRNAGKLKFIMETIGRLNPNVIYINNMFLFLCSDFPPFWALIFKWLLYKLLHLVQKANEI